jgi:hypothetical protein
MQARRLVYDNWFRVIMSKIELPTTLLDTLRGLISQARQQAVRSIDVIQVQTYWQIGRHVIEFEQGGQARATYGKRLIAELANVLTAEFGKGFDASNLRYMRLFYQAFPNCDALRHELSWTHYRLLLRVDHPEVRLWYMKEAAEQNWSTRVLERQISTSLTKTLDKWICMCGCTTTSAGAKMTTLQWVFYSVVAKTDRWCAILFCMRVSNYSLANTVWCFPARRSCAKKSNGNTRRLLNTKIRLKKATNDPLALALLACE